MNAQCTLSLHNCAINPLCLINFFFCSYLHFSHHHFVILRFTNHTHCDCSKIHKTKLLWKSVLSVSYRSFLHTSRSMSFVYASKRECYAFFLPYSLWTFYAAWETGKKALQHCWIPRPTWNAFSRAEKRDSKFKWSNTLKSAQHHHHHYYRHRHRHRHRTWRKKQTNYKLNIVLQVVTDNDCVWIRRISDSIISILLELFLIQIRSGHAEIRGLDFSWIGKKFTLKRSLMKVSKCLHLPFLTFSKMIAHIFFTFFRHFFPCFRGVFSPFFVFLFFKIHS